ncbi:MAG: maltokinase N-terminal cap-like domain-containing protein [Streptosporangiaceae bacterium]
MTSGFARPATSVDAVTLLDMLARWLPSQRWFPGRELPVSELAITADTELAAGDPGLRHVIITASAGPAAGRYQLLVGLRSQLPDSLGYAVIGTLPTGLTAYDAAHDPELSPLLLRGIAGQATVGPLRFIREPGAEISSWPGSRVMTAEQSNTSIVFGEAAILKLMRRVFPGPNPDLEVAGALARLGSAQVAAPFGWIETDLDEEPALLAVLSQYLAHASDGWSVATGLLRRMYARLGGYGQEYLTAPVPQRHATAAGESAAAPAEVPFAGDAYLLGQATGRLHADMATAFGGGQLEPSGLAALAARMTDKLERARAEVPALDPYAAMVRRAYDDLAAVREPVAIQRIHGDYHLGQVLRTAAGWVALDFEGEPAAPVAQRRALAPALQDVAGMLRSFDYAARHQLIGHPEAGQLRLPASQWVRQCQAAFCAGYADAGGADPQANAALLRALTLEKAVYEVIYEYRHRPAWLSIPLESIAAA